MEQRGTLARGRPSERADDVGVPVPDVAEHSVQHESQPARPARCHQVVEVLLTAKTRIDAELVDAVVTVRLRRELRPEQQPGCTELDRVVQPPEQPPQSRGGCEVGLTDGRAAEAERVDVPSDRVPGPAHRGPFLNGIH